MRSTTSTRKILVIDDDLPTRVTLTCGLAQAGYEVLEADNAGDAVLLVHQLRPALAPCWTCACRAAAAWTWCAACANTWARPSCISRRPLTPPHSPVPSISAAAACALKPLDTVQSLPMFVREVDQASVK